MLLSKEVNVGSKNFSPTAAASITFFLSYTLLYGTHKFILSFIRFKQFFTYFSIAEVYFGNILRLKSKNHRQTFRIIEIQKN